MNMAPGNPNLISLPKVDRGPLGDVGVDHLGVVHVDEERQLLFAGCGGDLHAHKLARETDVLLELTACSNSRVVHFL